jgi:hypothetical protein
MAGFTYRLEHEDGTPADPPTFHTVVPTWRPGDTITLGADRALRVIEVRAVASDENPVLVVEGHNVKPHVVVDSISCPRSVR